MKVGGWEEWELGDDLKVKASLGWYDADDYTDGAREAEANPTGARLKTAKNSVSRSKRRQRRSAVD